MIEVRNVTKIFGDFTAIEDLSMSVGKSSVYGLVGYNGAGKTTLLKTIAGVYKADGGEVLIDGINSYDSASAKKKIFYVPDDIYFEAFSTIAKMAKFYSGFYEKFSFNLLDRLCEVFGLDKNAKLNSFSKGMQRQAELVLGLSTNPQIILLDESFDGLDPAKRNLMNKMLIEYSADRECSIIISSHNLHELTEICDHIALINGKKIVMDCCVDDISASRCKFRLAFAEEKTEKDFDGLSYNKFRQDGRIITLTMKGDADENEDILKKYNPLLIDRYPLTLEEIFLEEMEGKDYDFSEIFG